MGEGEIPMQPLERPIRDRPNSVEFFSHSPFRHPLFLADTVMFVCAVVLCILIMILTRPLGLMALSMFVAVLFLIFLWVLTIRTHSEIYALLLGGQVEALERGSPLEIALRGMSNLMNMGLSFALFVILACLSALSDVVRFH
ncbi:MAG: hypothetical protein ACREAC_01820 [Blastocatellia bacterium]